MEINCFFESTIGSPNFHFAVKGGILIGNSLDPKHMKFTILIIGILHCGNGTIFLGISAFFTNLAKNI